MLYVGSVYKNFIVDRLAMGYPVEVIAELFKETYGDFLDVSFILEVKGKNVDLIKERERELFEDLEKNSVSVESRLESLYSEVRGVLDELKEKKQWKQYSSVLSGLLRNIELIAKSLGRYENKGKGNVNVQLNNYNAIVLLEKNGVISLKDKKKLKKLLGIEEAIEDYA